MEDKPINNLDDYARMTWKYRHRLHRCINRALHETGIFAKNLTDCVIYGSSQTTPEEHEIVNKRVLELMEGLKP